MTDDRAARLEAEEERRRVEIERLMEVEVERERYNVWRARVMFILAIIWSGYSRISLDPTSVLALVAFFGGLVLRWPTPFLFLENVVIVSL